MDYTEMTAAELKALCVEKGIKPSRAKADMVEDLKARDAADELSLEANLQQFEEDVLVDRVGGSVEPVQMVPIPFIPEALQKAADEPSWVSEGRLFKRYQKEDSFLDEDEHEENLRDIVEEAVIRNLDYYGPPFRVDDPDTDEWVYAINVH
jgi:hypothetical protein